MSNQKTTRELFAEAYKGSEHKVEEQKELELDLDQASPFMLMKLGFEKLVEGIEKQETPEEELVSEREYHDAIFKLEEARRELEQRQQLMKALEQDHKNSLSD
jgi:hypothetical protein